MSMEREAPRPSPVTAVPPTRPPVPERVARRRRRKRRPFPYPLRVALVMSAGMIVAWFSFQVLVKIVHPYQLGSEEARKVAELRARLNRQNQENVSLRAHIAFLKSDEGAEAVARRAGFHRPGEIVYFLSAPTSR